MSVGKLNQLFKNDGFLTPEKRCSKPPAQYRYERPKNFKVLFSREGNFFPSEKPTAEEIPVYRAPSLNSFLVVSDYKVDPRPYENFTQSIHSALSFVKTSREKYKNLKQFNVLSANESVRKSISNLSLDLEKVRKLSSDVAQMRSKISQKIKGENYGIYEN